MRPRSRTDEFTESLRNVLCGHVVVASSSKALPECYPGLFLGCQVLSEVVPLQCDDPSCAFRCSDRFELRTSVFCNNFEVATLVTLMKLSGTSLMLQTRNFCQVVAALRLTVGESRPSCFAIATCQVTHI